MGKIISHPFFMFYSRKKTFLMWLEEKFIKFGL